MRVLIDTNVLVDYLSYREPYARQAMEILALSKERQIQANMAAHSVPNIFYILRKDFTADELRKILLSLCEFLFIAGIGSNQVIASLENADFLDFEDCLQAECAKVCNADYIVTRNCADFRESTIPALEPPDFLALIRSKEDKPHGIEVQDGTAHSKRT